MSLEEGEEKEITIKEITIYTRNQYGERIAKEEWILYKKGEKLYLHKSWINCWSSEFLGLGTCQCFWHDPYGKEEYRVFPLEEITDVKEIPEASKFHIANYKLNSKGDKIVFEAWRITNDDILEIFEMINNNPDDPRYKVERYKVVELTDDIIE